MGTDLWYTLIKMISKQNMEGIMADLNVGDKAPDFSLPITLEEKVTLSEVLKEKTVVLAFYIFDFAGDLAGL